jgi:hypothetical protein
MDNGETENVMRENQCLFGGANHVSSCGPCTANTLLIEMPSEMKRLKQLEENGRLSENFDFFMVLPRPTAQGDHAAKLEFSNNFRSKRGRSSKIYS